MLAQHFLSGMYQAALIYKASHRGSVCLNLAVAHLHLLTRKRHGGNVEHIGRHGNAYTRGGLMLDLLPARRQAIGDECNRDANTPILQLHRADAGLQSALQPRIYSEDPAVWNVVNFKGINHPRFQPTIDSGHPDVKRRAQECAFVNLLRFVGQYGRV